MQSHVKCDPGLILRRMWVNYGSILSRLLGDSPEAGVLRVSALGLGITTLGLVPCLKTTRRFAIIVPELPGDLENHRGGPGGYRKSCFH